MSAEITAVSPGVVRVSWSNELQEQGLRVSAEEVRRVVESAFKGGSTRVETHVDPDDEAAQRVATFAGLMREGVARGVAEESDRIVYARLADDTPLEDPKGFRSLLNSFLPRKRAISQLLVRSTDGRVLLCQLTYKRDFDLPGGVVEVSESPQLAVAREVEEELGLTVEAGPLLLTDWLPPWGGWDDAICLVFDGGEHDPSVVDGIVRQEREIRSAGFFTIAEIREKCADFTARRIESALRNLSLRRPRPVVHRKRPRPPLTVGIRWRPQLARGRHHGWSSSERSERTRPSTHSRHRWSSSERSERQRDQPVRRSPVVEERAPASVSKPLMGLPGDEVEGVVAVRCGRPTVPRRRLPLRVTSLDRCGCGFRRGSKSLSTSSNTMSKLSVQPPRMGPWPRHPPSPPPR